MHGEKQILLSGLRVKAIITGMLVSLLTRYILAIPFYWLFGVVLNAFGNIGVLVSMTAFSGVRAFVGGYVAASLSPGHERLNSVIAAFLGITLVSHSFWLALYRLPSDFHKFNLSTVTTIMAYPVAPILIGTLIFSLAAGVLRQKTRKLTAPEGNA